MTSQGLLVITNNAPAKGESEFADWCSGQFVPAMSQVPGVNEAWLCRFPELQPNGGAEKKWQPSQIGAAPRYLQLYYLSSLDVLKQPEYLRLRGWGQGNGIEHGSLGCPVAQRMFSGCPNFTVGAYEHLVTSPAGTPDMSRANVVRLVSLVLKYPEMAAEWEDWYNTEHIPSLSSAPGAVRACRYRLVGNPENQGIPLPLLALYAAESLGVYSSDDYRRLGRTPWTIRMERHHTIFLSASYDRVALRCAAKA